MLWLLLTSQLSLQVPVLLLLTSQDLDPFSMCNILKRKFAFILGALRPQGNAGRTLTDQVSPAPTRVPDTSSSSLPMTLAASHLLQSLIIGQTGVAEI